MSIRDDYNQLMGMIKEMDANIKTLSELSDSTLVDIYGMNPNIKDVLMNISKEELESISGLSEINDILKKSNTDVKYYESAWNSLNPGGDEEKFVSSTKEMLISCKDSIEQVKNLEDEKNKISDELKQVQENWFEYVNSSEYKKKKLEKLSKLKSDADNETDPLKKKKILDMVNSMESGESLQFLFDRIEKNTETEIRSIKDSYFDSRKSQIIIKKFKSRLPRYNYNEDIYKMFFNLEEKFLPEEYKDLNNIFLFHVMRFISYTDTYNKRDSLYVSSILMKLYNLLYHKFGDNDAEMEFISVIKRLDDYFMPYIDEFKEKNITSPNHPVRKKRDEEYDQKLRVMIIASLQNEGIEPDTSLSTEELKAQLQEVIDKKSKEAEVEENESESASTDTVDTTEEVADDTPKEDSQETKVTRYYDRYGCYYEELPTGMFGYFENNGGRIEGEVVSEDIILRLMATESVKKTEVTVKPSYKEELKKMLSEELDRVDEVESSEVTQTPSGNSSVADSNIPDGKTSDVVYLDEDYILDESTTDENE